jgi:hypothetical protein
VSQENEEQFRCGPGRSDDPFPRGLTPRRQISELILTWRDPFLDRCDLSITIFRSNISDHAGEEAAPVGCQFEQGRDPQVCCYLILKRVKMHARYGEDKNQAPGQLSPPGESNKNAEPNDPTRVGQKVRQELR